MFIAHPIFNILWIAQLSYRILKKQAGQVTNTDGKTETINLAAHSDDSQATIDNLGHHGKKGCAGRGGRLSASCLLMTMGEYTFLDRCIPNQ